MIEKKNIKKDKHSKNGLILAIVSGKGGTGKTFVATNLAQSIDRPLLLLDCDVEEPNADLFFNPIVSSRENVTSFTPKINDAKCTKCNMCVEKCKFSALALVKNKLLFFEDLCTGCSLCLYVCPENAISESGRTIGEITSGFPSGKYNLECITGKTKVTVQQSRLVIPEVKYKIDINKINIIDCSAGADVNLLLSITNADYVLIVTEPTPMGLHDLQKSLEIIKIKGIDVGVIINKATIGDNRIEEFCKENNLPVLYKIPYSNEVEEYNSEGKLISQESIKWKMEFRKLFEIIEDDIYEGDSINKR